jgi:aminoglycoside N3'-acetyltransferase
MPGVCRSPHPTHSVAGWGRHARELLLDCPLTTAFGTDSPFYRMRFYDGLVVGLGVGLRQAFTIVHVIEELHPRTRELVFQETPYHMTIIDGAQTISYTSYALKGGVRRNPADLEKALLKDGTLRYVARRGLLFSVAQAGAFIERGLELIEKKVYIPV